MAIESSFTRRTDEQKKSGLESPSPELSSNNSKGSSQGDSDSESTSVTSSMQGSTSSATSSLDPESVTVKGGTRQTKTLEKSNSKKLSTFGSFIKSSRRRALSRLSQSSVKSSDDGLITPQHPSSIEASDESPNHFQKPMPKFTRTGSLRSVKIFKNKNKSSFNSRKSLFERNSENPEESHAERATFSSILKDSKFPEHLKHQAGPLEPEEVLPVAKFCAYQHCSLHGHHHHHHDPPSKRFDYLKRRTANDQKSVKPESQSVGKSSGKKRETKKNLNRESALDEVNTGDFSIEFYAKTRSEPVIPASHGHGDADFADILFGVNSFPEKNHQSCIDSKDENDENRDGSKRVLEKKPSLKKTNHMSMWRMIHPHMVSALTESADDPEKKSRTETKDFDDFASQETETRKMFAIKLVREAIEKILLPELQDDQSVTSEVVSEQDVTEKNQSGGETAGDRKETPPAADDVAAEGKSVEEPPEKKTPKSWSYLKKVILLRRFVKELEKVKKFDPKKPRHLPAVPEPEPETVNLRRNQTGDKKNSDEWMLDYALQKVVSELAPTQKRKVSLLVKAFETVAPAPDDPQESRSNTKFKRVGSETKDKSEETSRTTQNASGEEKKTEENVDKRIKMWHMVYQHVATDIATKVGSELLLDGEDSVNGEDKNLQEVEDPTERTYRLGFTQSDAFKLVRDSIDEILLPDDLSSQESRSISSDEPTMEAPGNVLLHQNSKNWSKLKKLILVKRSIKALESFRKLKPKAPQEQVSKSDPEVEKMELRCQMTEERRKAEQWMLDYAVQHIVTKLTPARKRSVLMLVEAFEAVVPFPEI